MDIANIKYIYYQGLSTDCNYNCSYCYQTKSNDFSAWNDERYLNKFVNYIRKAKFYQQVSVMFTPHGEVLNKEYYYKAIAILTQSDNVALVCCQTNGHFEAIPFLKKMTKYRANLKKLSLWLSYHPETLGLRLYGFANTVIELSYAIKVSVGAVGIREYGNDIVILHNNLPPRIYYWINRFNDSNAELDKLYTKIDECYPLENTTYKCDIDTCNAGINSLFVKGKGEVFLCYNSKKSFGNLYEDDEIIREKSATKCDCYLTYSQKKDINFPSHIHKFRFSKI